MAGLTSSTRVLCIGWDVGGWLGNRDGIAALQVDSAGDVGPVGRPHTCGLGRAIAEGEFTLEYLLNCLAVEQRRTWNRVVIGVDAPFGLPRAFVEATVARFDDVPAVEGGFPSSVIESRLAYRDTDRIITGRFRRAFGKSWRPLSPSFDAMGSNVSKARCALAQLRKNGASILPFERDALGVAVLEVYPALWNAAPIFQPNNTLLGDLLGELDAVSGGLPDVRDALRAALVAACYELTRSGRRSSILPWVVLPDAAATDGEGWIYSPAL